jgi:hypothetical protein
MCFWSAIWSSSIVNSQTPRMKASSLAGSRYAARSRLFQVVDLSAIFPSCGIKKVRRRCLVEDEMTDCKSKKGVGE